MYNGKPAVALSMGEGGSCLAKCKVLAPLSTIRGVSNSRQREKFRHFRKAQIVLRLFSNLLHGFCVVTGGTEIARERA
jgi:hypothetical protein